MVYKKQCDPEKARIASLILSIRYYYRAMRTNSNYKLRMLKNKKYFYQIEKKLLSTIDQLKDADVRSAYEISNDLKNEMISYVSTFLEFINAKHNFQNGIALEKEKKLELILKQNKRETIKRYRSIYGYKQYHDNNYQEKIEKAKEKRKKAFEEHYKEHKRIIDLQMENKKLQEEFEKYLKKNGRSIYLEKDIAKNKSKEKKWSFKINFTN